MTFIIAWYIIETILQTLRERIACIAIGVSNRPVVKSWDWWYIC